MNTLSILIYLAGVTGTLGSFVTFMAVIFGVLAAVWVVVWAVCMDETDRHGRIVCDDQLKGLMLRRRAARTAFVSFLILMIITGLTAATIPSRETVLMIAASELGERTLRSDQAQQIINPGMDLLTAWIQQQNSQLQNRASR